MMSSPASRLACISRHLLLRAASSSAEEILEPRPVIIGGMVLDILAVPDTQPGPGTTTPGKVTYVCGGVARNIAESVSKLGCVPFMISVVGNDIAGDILLSYWRSGGLCQDGIRQLSVISTPVVSNLFDSQGELLAAVANVDAVEAFLTANWIKKFRHVISAAPAVLLDANLPSQCLQTACEMAQISGVPVWFEPVSVLKSQRIASIAHYVTCASPNERELFAMANALSPVEHFDFSELDSMKDQAVDMLLEVLRPPILFLLREGIKLLLVTLGSNGVFLCCKDQLTFIKDNSKFRDTAFMSQIRHQLEGVSTKELHNMSGGLPRSCIYHFPAVPASVVRLTGAGDCLVGGCLTALCCGLDIMCSVAFGISVAKAAVESETNVPSSFCITSISEEAKSTLLAARKVWLE